MFSGTGEALLRTFDSLCAAAANTMKGLVRRGVGGRVKIAVMP